MVDAKVPTPDRESGSLRLVRVLELFRELGFDVTLVPSFPSSFPPFDGTLARDEERLRGSGVEIPCLEQRDPADAYIARHAPSFDLALLSGVLVAARHFQVVRAAAPSLPILFDTIDLHHLREYRHAKLSGSAPRAAEALKLKRLEVRVAEAADFTLVVSEREAEILSKEAPRARPWVVSMALDTPESVPPFGGRRDILYLGAFTFSPNVDAMAFFVRDVLPAVERALPGVALSIVGSDPTDDVRALAGPSVRVVGPVADLGPAFDAHRVFVAPLRYGAGVKGKVQLALGHGLPAVVSPIAAEGIPLEDGRDVLIAGDPDAWAREVASLYRDEALWNRLSASGRALAERHYSRASVRESLEALVSAVYEARRAG